MIQQPISVGFVTASVSRSSGGMFDATRGNAQALAEKGGVDIEIYGVRDDRTAKDLPDWQPLVPHVFPPLWKSFALASGLEQALGTSTHDIMHQHGLWLYPSLAVLRWRKIAKKPLIISPHGMLDPWAVRHSHLKKSIAATLFERENLQGATCIHALNQSEAEAVRSYGLENPIAIIPNGISIPNDLKINAALTVPPPWNQKHNRNALLFLGRLHPKKGIFEILRAWAKLKNESPKVAATWCLVLAGWDDGGHTGELMALASRLGLLERQDVIIPGPFFGEKKAAAFAHAAAFVLPSHSEGLPMSVLEAWSYKKPVFMTAACNLPDGFKRNAAVKITTNPDSIAASLAQHLLREDLQDLGKRGRSLVADRYTWTQIAEDFTTLYRWMCTSNAAPPPFVTMTSEAY